MNKGLAFFTLAAYGLIVSEDAFDQIFDRLKAVVDKLEQGNLTLEESLRAFEEGVALARRGHAVTVLTSRFAPELAERERTDAILDAADKRVELLVRGPEGDGLVPFKPEG